MTPGLLPGADRDLVRPLQKKLSELMEDILLESKVATLQPGEDAVEVELEGKAEGKRSFDRVLISVGRRPNSADLGLEHTDVELDERGFVKVDTRQRTADGKILAIGDVAGEPMLAHKASAEAKVAVDTVAGEDAEFMPRAIPAVVFTDPELAWAGITQTQAEAENVAVEVSTYPWAASGRAQALGRPEGLTKLLTDPKTQRVLGVGMVGAGCGELIAEAALAMEMGCTAEDLAETIHPHPTLNETITNAAEVLLGSAVEIYKPRRKS
jgi:dihydrolipoamide dehydrogenase